MSYLDLLLALPIVFGLIRGFMKGMIVELTSIMALILGVYGAILLSNSLAEFLAKHFDWSRDIIAIIAFALVFAAILILVHLLARIIERGIKLAALGLVNKLAGALIGGLKMALVVSVLLLIVDKIDRHMDFVPADEKSKSLLYEPVANVTREHFPKLVESNAFEKLKERTEDWNDRLREAIN
jgi:membrane protein required for colicin V production